MIGRRHRFRAERSEQGHGHDREQGPRDVRPRGAQAGAEADGEGRRRVRPFLVHGHRGAPEELCDHAVGARLGARRRNGVRRLVDHGLQRDRGVGHDRDPRPVHVPPDADTRGRGEGRTHDLRCRHAERRALRGRPPVRPPARASANGLPGVRHVQHRAGARVLPVRGQRVARSRSTRAGTSR